MRVGFFVGRIQPEEYGGGNTFQVSIIDELKNITSRHEIFIYYENEKGLFQDSQNIKFINLHLEKIMKRKRRFYQRKKHWVEPFDLLIQRDKIELIYFLTPAFNIPKVPYIATVWDLAHRVHPYFPEVSTTGWTFDMRETHYSKALPQATYVVIGNNAGKNQVCRYYNIDESRVRTIPMITPRYVYELEADNSILERCKLEPQKYLFYPAQFWPHKNHIRLVKAMKILKNQGFKLVFTGAEKGNKKYIEKMVNEFGLTNDILFLGFVSKKELISLYKNAYALAYVSFFGPDNIPPLEAMALKCPVIYPKIEGAQEQLQDCTLYFNLLDENDLIAKIENLKDEKLRNRLIEKGEKLAHNCHVKNYVESMLKIIDEFVPIRECWDKKYEEAV